MTKKRKFQKGDVLVCIKTQRYACGAMKLREGGLVKAADDESWDYVDIFRSIRDEGDVWKIFSVESEKMRLATPEEAKRYERGIRII